VFDNQVKSVDDLMQKVSKLLSTLTDEASLVIFPRFEMQHFKKVSLIRMDGARVIAVWVSSSGFVWHGAIELDEVADLEMLTRLVNFMNSEMEGMAFHAMESVICHKLEECRSSLAKSYELAIKVIRGSLKFVRELKLFLDGSRNVLEKPEFDDVQKNRRFIHLFESKEKWTRIFDRSIATSGVRVSIGNEAEEMKTIEDCSLVTSTYHLKDDSIGLLGVLGPKRMDYPKVISLVDFIACETGNMLSRYF
ncbi:MAG: hypothetical protein HY586_02350, partial [Candidatus Omnitrophica bacterium]|nr:hypothetical protein [Candidatus Omnitrophota bacterium]